MNWSIKANVGEQLKTDLTYVQNDLFRRTMTRLAGVDPRLVTICIYFAEKVIMWNKLYGETA